MSCGDAHESITSFQILTDMISGYTRPQLIIREVLDSIADTDQLSLHAFVFGPQFDLFRYTNPAERAAMKGQLFVFNDDSDPSAQQLIPYEGLKSTHIVDTAFVRLFAENMEGQLWLAQSHSDDNPNNPLDFVLTGLNTPNQLQVVRRGAIITVTESSVAVNLDHQMATAAVEFAGSGYAASSTFDVPVVGGSGSGAVVRLASDSTGVITSVTVISPGFGYRETVTFTAPAPAGVNVGVADDTLLADLHGRPVQAGDVLYSTLDDKTVRRVVRQVNQELTPATISDFVASSTNPSQTDVATFGNTAAPAEWVVDLQRFSIYTLSISAPGSGYGSTPTVTISAPAVVNGGHSGVNTDNIAAGITPWASEQAVASVQLSGGSVVTAILDDPGFGYLNGGVYQAVVGSRGTGFSAAHPPQIVVTDPQTAGGRKAVFLAYVANDGTLQAIEVIDPGSGYTGAPTLTVVGGTTGATATAFISAAPTAAPNAGNATLAVTTEAQASNWNGLVAGSSYNGQYGERYTLTVTRGGGSLARLRIRSSSGAFTADNVVPTVFGDDSSPVAYSISHAALGGLSIMLRNTGEAVLQLGDQFSFVVIGKYLPLSLSPSGQVLSIALLKPGTSGYVAGNALTFSPPPAGGRIAAGHIKTVSTGVITALEITDPGAGYIYPPLVTAPTGVGAMLQSTIATAENSCDLAIVGSSEYVGTSNNRYKVTVTAGSTPGGQNSFDGATIRVQDTAGVDVVKTFDVDQGTQYNLGSFGLKLIFPINLASPSGIAAPTTATASSPTVDGGGAITDIVITNPGNGYTVPPIVTLSGPDNGAVLVAVLANGTVESIRILDGGASYAGTETVTFSAPTTYQGGLRTGDSYYVDVTAPAANGTASIIVLNGQITDITGWTQTDVDLSLFDIELRALFSGEVEQQLDPDDAPDLGWTAGLLGVSVKNNLKMFVADRDDSFQWVEFQATPYARLFASWRGLVPAATNESIIRYFDPFTIIAAFGANDPDNPVCYGACVAISGSQGKSIFVARLQTNDLAGYNIVLQQAARIQGPYALAPMTEDLDVVQALSGHVTDCSTAQKQLWRRGYVFTDSPGAYVYYNVDTSGNTLQGQVLANQSGNVRVVCPNAQFLIEGIRPGDLFRTQFSQDAWGNVDYEQFVVQEVLEDDELILLTGPTSPITPGIRFEIWRPDTGQTQAEFVGARSVNLLNRRIANVWSDNPLKLNANAMLVSAPGIYMAAEIAGLRSALLPQQGLTHTELVASVNAAPTMYTKFTDDNLDIAAADGVMIVTQELFGGPLFIRHQLTTDTNNGPLYYEDSVGTNLDNIAYAFKGVFRPYIGKRNATPQVVEEIDVRARAILDGFKSTPTGFTTIGPAIIDYTNLVVQIDPVFRDRVTSKVTLQLPLPLNVLDMTLEATQIQDDNTSISISVSQSGQ